MVDITIMKESKKDLLNRTFLCTYCASDTYSKTCVKRPLTKIFMTNGRLMKVKSIAECSPRRAFCNTFDLH